MYQSGFEIGSTVNSQTKGIYIWGTPVDVNHNGENMKVLLVDTEGIGSVEKDETYPHSSLSFLLFSLSPFLSSLSPFSLSPFLLPFPLAILKFFIFIL